MKTSLFEGASLRSGIPVSGIPAPSPRSFFSFFSCFPRYRPVSLFFVPVILSLSLSACAMPPSPGSPGSPVASSASSASMSSALLKSVNQIAQITDDIRATSGTRWSPHYDGFPMKHADLRPHGSTASSQLSGIPSSSPLAQKVYVQWSGSAETFLRSLAQKMGDRFVSRVQGQVIPDVAVYARRETIAQVLRTVAVQLPDNYVVQVNPGEIVLKTEGF